MKHLFFALLFALTALFCISCSGGDSGGGGGGGGGDTYTVTYYDGTFVQNEAADGDVIDLPTPAKNDYLFTGWLENNTGTPKVGKYAVTGDVVFFASWVPQNVTTPATYTLAFYNASTLLEDITITADLDATITLPSFTPPAGYIFAGWLKENSGNILNGSYYVTENTVFYAALTPQDSSTPNIYTITFYDGDTFLASISSTAGEDEVITLPAYSKPGYALNGWKLNDTGSALSDSFTVTENAKFYADLTLTGTPTIERSVSYYDGTNLLYTVYAADGSVITLPTRTKTDYTFNGWKENGIGEPKKGDYTVTANVDFYADMTHNGTNPIQWTVAFYNYGTIQNSLTRLVDTDTNIILPTLAQEDLLFNGWLLNNTGAPYLGVITVTSDMAFYAKWTPGSVTSYTANFYVVGALVPDYTKTVEISQDITLPTPVKAGYTFSGWYINNTGSSYSADTPYSLSANVNFYAKWTPVDSSVAKVKAVFYDDGIQVNSIEEYAVNAITLPTAAAKNSYTFNGWRVGATTNIVNGIYVISANTDFTADFSLNAPVVEIKTAEDLAAINVELSGRYRLMNSIDLSTYISEHGGSWTPIGSYDSQFTGIFEGGGHEISGLTINDSVNDHVGLFGVISGGARIADLTVVVTVAGIIGKTNAGGIVGYAHSSSSTNSTKIVNSHATRKSGIGVMRGEITVSGSSIASAGGIVGLAENYVTIIGCSNEVPINSSVFAGGIAGQGGDYGKIYNSLNTGRVSSKSPSVIATYTGGIIGHGSFSITNSHNSGVISGSASQNAYAGGINGYGSNITASYNTGTVNATGNAGPAHVGGITGYATGSYTMNQNFNSGTVYAVSASDDAYAGGIAGYLYTYDGSISNSYNTGAIGAAAGHPASKYAHAGGIVGYQYGASTVSETYNIGYVSASSSIGKNVYAAGIVGYMDGSLGGSYTIKQNAAANSSVTGDTTGTGTITINRVLGYTTGVPTMQNNFALDTMSPGSASFGTAPQLNGTDKTSTELTTVTTYSNDTTSDGLGWKFGSDSENPWVWGAFPGYQYPTLYWQTEAPQ
jgi:uncharacterized repeat protein (TIGR02543 family)